MTVPRWQSYADAGIEYRGHKITVKQDFGSGFHLIDGLPCAWGYVVLKGGCNVSPGAAWYETVADAKVAVDILCYVGGEKNSDRFWRIMRGYQSRLKHLQEQYADLPMKSRKADVVEVARNNGAKIVPSQSQFETDSDPKLWKVLDQGEHSPLWWALFDSEEAAARAFLAAHNITVPK